MTDSELIAAIQNPVTQRSGFNLLVKTYQQKVYWLARKMVIDHDDSHDLTQDIFIKVWKSLDQFKGDSKLYTWIYRIAVNECLMFLRKKKLRQTVSIEMDNHDLAASLDSSPLIDGTEIQLRLQKALLTLPDKQRLVFNMKYFDDMKYEDISESLGTSVGALKASFHLAVKKIESYMTQSINSYGN